VFVWEPRLGTNHSGFVRPSSARLAALILEVADGLKAANSEEGKPQVEARGESQGHGRYRSLPALNHISGDADRCPYLVLSNDSAA